MEKIEIIKDEEPADPWKLDKFITKIVNGLPITSNEELQLYLNNSEAIESRLKELVESMEECAER